MPRASGTANHTELAAPMNGDHIWPKPHLSGGAAPHPLTLGGNTLTLAMTSQEISSLSTQRLRTRLVTRVRARIDLLFGALLAQYRRSRTTLIS